MENKCQRNLQLKYTGSKNNITEQGKRPFILLADDIHTLLYKVTQEFGISIGMYLRKYPEKPQPTDLGECLKRLKESEEVEIEVINRKKNLCNSEALTPVTVTGTKSTSKPTPSPHIQSLLDTISEGYIVLGPNGTKILKSTLNSINWRLSNGNIIRTILMEVFGSQILASSTLSGKMSPVLLGNNKLKKIQLDQAKVEDIIFFIKNNLNISTKEVKRVISIKCADEHKLARKRERKLAEKKTGL